MYSLKVEKNYLFAMQYGGYSNNPDSMGQITFKDRSIQGIQFVICGLYLAYAVSFRIILVHWGIPISTRLVSQFGNLAVFILIVTGAFLIYDSGIVKKLSYIGIRIWSFLWVSMILFQFTIGIARGNQWSNCGQEAIALLSFVPFLLIGVDDRVWNPLKKHFTILFYITVPVVFFYYKTPGTRVGIEEISAMDVSLTRYTGSLGYQFRILLKPALWITMVGLVDRGKGGILKILQVLAVPVFFVIEVGLFKFRSLAVLSMGVFISFLFLRPILERRIRPKMCFALIAVGLLGFSYFMTTEAYELLYKRAFVYTDKEGMLESRDAELSAFFLDMNNISLITGRGMGGGFNAYKVYRFEMAKNWRTLHYGIFIFILKGGFIMFLFFIYLLQKCIRLRPKQWYQNSYNLTAALLIPLYFLSFCLIPFDLRPESIPAYAPSMLVISRFFRYIEIDSNFYRKTRLEN